MKNQKYLFIILLSGVIGFFLFFSLFVNCKIETFEEKDNSDMKMYVISLKQPKRIENIETQEKKLGKNITVIDAVKGDILDIDELIDKGLISEKSYKKSNIEYKKREIGCYMSHLKIYNLIKNSNSDNYSIIFEDDFNLESDNFLETVNDSINNLNKKEIDFDLLFLGNHNSNHGEKIVDNIYHVNSNEQLLGTHCYVVNNANIDKIISHTKLIDTAIDIKLDTLSKSNKLTILVLYPTIANQAGSNYSSIRDMNIETFTHR